MLIGRSGERGAVEGEDVCTAILFNAVFGKERSNTFGAAEDEFIGSFGCRIRERGVVLRIRC